jgi:hypothetical protein
LTKQSELSSTFDGFKSQWISSPEWMYLIPFRI